MHYQAQSTATLDQPKPEHPRVVGGAALKRLEEKLARDGGKSAPISRERSPHPG